MKRARFTQHFTADTPPTLAAVAGALRRRRGPQLATLRDRASGTA